MSKCPNCQKRPASVTLHTQEGKQFEICPFCTSYHTTPKGDVNKTTLAWNQMVERIYKLS